MTSSETAELAPRCHRAIDKLARMPYAAKLLRSVLNALSLAADYKANRTIRPANPSVEDWRIGQ